MRLTFEEQSNQKYLKDIKPISEKLIYHETGVGYCPHRPPHPGASDLTPKNN